MQPFDEPEDVTACVQCGAVVEGPLDRSYSYGDELTLCFECSVARGGAYDEVLDRWAVAPDLQGLPGDVEHEMHPAPAGRVYES